MRLKLLLLISFSFCSWVLWGQSSGFSFENIGTNKVIAPSPTAASLGKYGNIPIGLYTGAPDIKVPLYDINLSDIKVPVFLNYSGGGVKVGELASWVGLGWSLNAGGAITRVTRGLPDEMRLYSSNPSINLNPTNDQAADYITNIKDGQVDVFYFNFLGRAGRFVLDEEKKAFICPDQKMVIEPTKYEMVSFPTFNGQLVELMRYVITEWKIVDENGNQYYFSAYEPTRSYSRFTSNGNDGNFSSIVYSGDMNLWQATVNAWYISKIITSNGNQVQFSYNDKELIYDMPAEERRYLVQNAVPVNYTGQIKDGKITGQRLYINSKQLSEISFPGGRVSFTPSTISRGDLIGDKTL